jgi:hypothetical protein
MTDLQAWREYVREGEEAWEFADNRRDTIWQMERRSSEGYLEAVAQTSLRRSLCEARWIAMEAFTDWRRRSSR